MKMIRNIVRIFLLVALCVDQSGVLEARGGRGGGGRGRGGGGFSRSGGGFSRGSGSHRSRPSRRVNRSSRKSFVRSPRKNRVIYSRQRHVPRIYPGFGYAYGVGPGFGVGIVLGGRAYPWNYYSYWGQPMWWGAYAYYPRYGCWWHKNWGLWYYPWSYSWFDPSLSFWYYPRFGMTVHVTSERRSPVIYVENSADKSHYFAVYFRKEVREHGKVVGYDLDRVYMSDGLDASEKVKVLLPHGSRAKDYVVLVDDKDKLADFLQQDENGKFLDKVTRKSSGKNIEIKVESLNEKDEKYYKSIQKKRGDTTRYIKLQEELDGQAQKFSDQKQPGEDAAVEEIK